MILSEKFEANFQCMGRSVGWLANPVKIKREIGNEISLTFYTNEISDETKTGLRSHHFNQKKDLKSFLLNR